MMHMTRTLSSFSRIMRTLGLFVDIFHISIKWLSQISTLLLSFLTITNLNKIIFMLYQCLKIQCVFKLIIPINTIKINYERHASSSLRMSLVTFICQCIFPQSLVISRAWSKPLSLSLTVTSHVFQLASVTCSCMDTTRIYKFLMNHASCMQVVVALHVFLKACMHQEHLFGSPTPSFNFQHLRPMFFLKHLYFAR